jgi:hypothetical protein
MIAAEERGSSSRARANTEPHELGSCLTNRAAAQRRSGGGRAALAVSSGNRWRSRRLHGHRIPPHGRAGHRWLSFGPYSWSGENRRALGA